VLDNRLIFKAKLKKGIYYVHPKMLHKSNKVALVASISTSKNLELWHRRLGHASSSVMTTTSKSNCVVGLPKFTSTENLNCEDCKLNKFKRVSFKSCPEIRSKAPLELLHADVWGGPRRKQVLVGKDI